MNLDHAFLCGNHALDFAATLRARRSVRFETFVSPDRLDAWYLESGIVDAVSASQEADVEQAIAVREAVYELVTARIAQDAYGSEALAVVNDMARKPPVAPQLTVSGRWTDATPEEALATVARHAVELLGGPDVPLLKECGNPECTRVYIDRSRGMRRQWCGMEPCGNKLKAAAYRARKKQVQVAPAG
ncbi:CGNR zinc finger domain-containing protein [Streptomyces sp. ME19-01-6]|uniref:CGNR zinc finger domain-containing protein n=1 Tax=Streptomyces sp. ME19-01-6 TaxID=3028686 RepID=UPI0029B68359|nr:ABATE domain-containing protein [Streptomyces sp. ME19-01-6]MDX3233350.1 ABATE domain-containing protein [Streptomyces sp. ME19-01-6]